MLTKYFSPESKFIRLEKKLQKAISEANEQQVISFFCKGFWLLLRENEKEVELFSSLIYSYLPKIKDITSLEKEISADSFKQAISLLEKNKHDSAAIIICDFFGFDSETIEIFTKRGRSNDLASWIAKKKNINKELLQTAIVLWEKYNGDIRENLTLSDVFKGIAKFSMQSIPENPRVMEIVGLYQKAAELYSKEKDITNAGRCYEKAEMYQEANQIYKEISDKEGISRTAEALENWEEALKYTTNLKRKIKLLIRMERFYEARRFATDLESPSEFFDLIREKARERIEVKIRSFDFIGGLELVDIAEYDDSKKEEILSLGQQHLKQKFISAKSDEDILSLHRERVALEEKAGNFEKAGIIAEEDLKDLELASSLYEKANLFNIAIDKASKHFEGKNNSNEAKIRLAKLHERGGNLLSAATLYESIGMYEKASSIYQNLMNFHKAIDCYLKVPDYSQEALIQLYTNAGEFEKVIDIYLKSEEFSDLEKALSLAKIHNLKIHERSIQNKINKLMSGTEEDLKQCFLESKDEVITSYSMMIGIDFGTTNSVVAIYNKKSGKVEIIPSSDGTQLEPSFFGVDEEEHPIFGEKARRRSHLSPHSVIARIKRHIGDSADFQIGKKRYRTEEIAARILERLKMNAEEFLASKVEAVFYSLLEKRNLRFPQEITKKYFDKQRGYNQIKDVVLSVPAYYNDNQKRATKDAAEIAGLNVKRLIHEPTAAALAYGYRHAYCGKVVVIDLGGGTLDISILDVGSGVYDVKTVGGDIKLGGSDIDAILLSHVIEYIRLNLNLDITENMYPTETARLRDACEDLKINLSSLNQYTIELTYFLNQPKFTFSMDRKELEKISKPILERIKTTIENTVKGVPIDNFLLVGNATKMPAVIDLLKKGVSGKYLSGVNPATVVAEGAALQAAILSGNLSEALLVDIVPYSLGIEVKKRDESSDEIVKIIPKNSKIPVRKSDIFTTTHDDQSEVWIKVYQGESDRPYQNYFLGDFILKGIPLNKAGIPKIEVIFDIDANCILIVTAVDQITGNQQTIKIEGAVTLSPQDKQRLAKLFTETKDIYLLEKEWEKIGLRIDELKQFYIREMKTVDYYVKNFFELFREKVEVNTQFYRVNNDQAIKIQNIFLQRPQLDYKLQKYRDQFTSTINNISLIQKRHLDFSSQSISTELKERIVILSNFKETLETIITSVEKDITNVLSDWVQLLNAIEPNTEKMGLLETVNYHLTEGRINEAREILESFSPTTDNTKELTKESFSLYLKCYVRTDSRKEYRDTYKRFSNLLGIICPDFNQLNTFLKEIEDSVFMIQVISEEHEVHSGNGFCISSNLIVTNRHIVEGSTPSNIKVIGVNRHYAVTRIELDATNDLAVLKINDNLKPMKLGHFKFVEPGEQVVAVGFLPINTLIQTGTIYITKGIVNSIRKTDFSPERVIFTDAKVEGKIGGSPLINDLGEVTGIITFNTAKKVATANNNLSVSQMRHQEYDLTEYNLLRDKIHALRKAKYTETEAASKFKLDQEIKELEEDFSKIEEKLGEMKQLAKEEQPVALPIYLVDKYLTEQK